MGMMICPRCGYKDEHSIHCPECGAEYIAKTEWDKIPPKLHENRVQWLMEAAPFMVEIK